MGQQLLKQLLIAVDTNVLMDEEDGNDDVLDALALIRRRLPQAQFVVTEVVTQELAFLSENGSQSERELAYGALTNLLARKYAPLVSSPLERGIASEIALRIQANQLIPVEETNDATILAESALKGCGILLTSDRHLLDVNEQWDRFCTILEESDAQSTEVVISSPRSLVRQFGWRH